jgi:hypothetical protein
MPDLGAEYARMAADEDREAKAYAWPRPYCPTPSMNP